MSGFPFGSSSPASSQSTTPFSFTNLPASSPATSTGFLLGSSPSPFGSTAAHAATSTSRFSFGTSFSASTSSNPSSSSSPFPFSLNTTASPSAPAPAFGSSNPSSGPSPSFGFGYGASTATTASSAAAPSFGFGSSAATSAPSSLFGSSASTPLFGSSPAQPLFGSSSSAPASASASTLFGARSSTPSSLFGAPANSAAPSQSLFGSSSSTPASASTLFGAPSSTASSLFGAPASSAAPSQPLFGSSSSAPASASTLFGAPSSTASSLFGAPASSAAPSQPLFGSSSSVPASASTLFGAPSSTASSLFGAPASSVAPSGTWGLTGFGVTSAAASSTDFSLLTKGSSPASSSQAQPSTTVPAFGVTTSAPVAAMTTTQTSTSLVEASTSWTTSTVSTTISTAPKLPSEITGKIVGEAPLTSFKHETSYLITISGPSATSDCSKLVEQSTLAAEVQISTAISPPSSLDFDALDLETQLALICGGSSSSGFTPSVKAEQAISRIKLWQAKDFAVEEGHQSVGELINNLQILAEENLIPKCIFSSGVTSAQEFQQAADLWGTIHTSFEQAITCRNVYQRSAENLEKDRSQCFAQDFELQYLKNEALEVEAEIAKLQTQLKAIKTKEKEVRIKLQRNLRDAWELQKQITTAQPGLEESHALILRGSKLRAGMDAKFRVLKVILTSIVP